MLFLTDLRGYDVVFGKLLSHSLRAFYGVLAAFPVLALPLLVGGVTGGEFALSMLVIANTLFFSLALGLFVSTVSRDYTKAMSGTFLVCLLFFLGLAFVDSAIAASRQRTFQPVFSLANPAWLFSVTHADLPAGYWKAFGIQHGLAWGFLLAAASWRRGFGRKKAATPAVQFHLSRAAGGLAARNSGPPCADAGWKPAPFTGWPCATVGCRDWCVLALLVFVSEGFYLAEEFQAYFEVLPVHTMSFGQWRPSFNGSLALA